MTSWQVGRNAYLPTMPTPPDFALPVMAASVPDGPDWLHEVKHDGYRMMLIRDEDSVRLRTKNGFDWTERYPWVVESALKIRQKRFVLDGEIVVLGVDGISDFDALHSRRHDHEAQFYAFDILAGDGDDYRGLPLSLRKPNLTRLLARRPEGIFIAPFEQGEIGPQLFEAACRMGLEGLVSKDSRRVYREGRCEHWRKIKNPAHPSIKRVKIAFEAKARLKRKR